MNQATRISYFTQLAEVYAHVAGGKSSVMEVDNDFTSKALALLDLKVVPITEISRFCIDEHDAVERAFKYFDIQELKQPVSLLLFYYIEYYSNFIEYNWPFSTKLFRDYKLALGLSDNY